MLLFDRRERERVSRYLMSFSQTCSDMTIAVPSRFFCDLGTYSTRKPTVWYRYMEAADSGAQPRPGQP